MWGRIASCERVYNPRCFCKRRRLEIGEQVENLPHGKAI
jgi:hypothetical protein